MTPSDDCIDLIKQFEGFLLSAYLCPANVWTIGYGHTGGVQKGDEITEAEAEDILRDDVKDAADAVVDMVGDDTNQGQLDALVSFAFNCGAGALKKSTLLRHHNAGRFEEAGDEFLRWDKAGNKRLPGLTRRREAERLMYLGA